MTQNRQQTIEALYDLVVQGDMSFSEAVKYFREEFACGLMYMHESGFLDALKSAESLRLERGIR